MATEQKAAGKQRSRESQDGSATRPTRRPDGDTGTSLLRPLVEDLLARREQIRLGGGEQKIARQHEQDKLTARERLALLIDEGTFTEMGIHGRPHFSVRLYHADEPELARLLAALGDPQRNRQYGSRGMIWREEGRDVPRGYHR